MTSRIGLLSPRSPLIYSNVEKSFPILMGVNIGATAEVANIASARVRLVGGSWRMTWFLSTHVTPTLFLYMTGTILPWISLRGWTLLQYYLQLAGGHWPVRGDEPGLLSE